jgi:hypothetical protein
MDLLYLIQQIMYYTANYIYILVAGLEHVFLIYHNIWDNPSH